MDELKRPKRAREDSKQDDISVSSLLSLPGQPPCPPRWDSPALKDFCTVPTTIRISVHMGLRQAPSPIRRINWCQCIFIFFKDFCGLSWNTRDTIMHQRKPFSWCIAISCTNSASFYLSWAIRETSLQFHLCCHFHRSKGLPMQLPLLGHDHASLPRQRIKNNFLYALAGIYLLTHLLLFLSPIERSANSIQGDGLLFSTL